MRREPEQSVKRNVSEAFATFMLRLDDVYQARRPEAPHDFRERLDFWRAECELPIDLHGRMHTLRIWRNASEHDDQQRWAREGPRDAEEASKFIGGIEQALAAL